MDLVRLLIAGSLAVLLASCSGSPPADDAPPDGTGGTGGAGGTGGTGGTSGTGGTGGAGGTGGGFDCPGALDPVPHVTFAPVVPLAAPVTTEFEGFPVHSYVPEAPRGIIHLFHGTSGSADLALKIESVEVENALVEAGYGWVATESTERTADARWDVSPTDDNPDLARLERLHAWIVENTGAEPETPVFGIGMSNGAVFCGSFAYYFAVNGRLPVVAAAMIEGAFVRPVFEAGAPLLPTFHVRAENDTTADLPQIEEQLAAIHEKGTPPLVDHLAREVPLDPRRFQRVPAIDEAKAQEIFAELVRVGLVDGEGNRLVDPAAADPLFAQVRVSGVRLDDLVAAQDQLRVAWAVHEMRADYAAQNVAFFDCALR